MPTPTESMSDGWSPATVPTAAFTQDLSEPSAPLTVMIRGLLDSLQPAMARVGEFVVKNPGQVSGMTVSALAQETGVSEATVIRFCREIGVDGYGALRLGLAAEVAVRGHEDLEFEGGADISPGDDLRSAMEKIAYADQRSVIDTARGLSVEVVEQVVTALEHARRINIFGVGASGLVALDLQQKLNRIGVPAVAFLDPHQSLVAAVNSDKHSVAIAISHSGATIDTLDCLRVAKSKGATTVAITNSPRSPIVPLADHVLVTSALENTYRAAATGSRLAQLTAVDCLFVGLAQRTYERSAKALEKTRDVVASRRIGPSSDPGASSALLSGR